MTLPGDTDAGGEAREEGGDPACWSHLVCPTCGRILPDERASVCAACGSVLDED